MSTRALHNRGPESILVIVTQKGRHETKKIKKKYAGF